jgi:C4-dicarboxylate-specific signal transduction histidine kinase
MKLRLSVMALTLLCLVSVIIGTMLYYNLLKESVLMDADRRVGTSVNTISNLIAGHLGENMKAVTSLAGLAGIKTALAHKNGSALTAANRLLDHFTSAMEVSVCYLLDGEGKTIASSNRNAANSFVGKNYAFRPYFREAMSGRPSMYIALGVTSGLRGIYFGHPVFSDERQPMGVVVIKSTVDGLEKQLSDITSASADRWAMVDEKGVVFISNQPEWRFHFLWEPDPVHIRELEVSRQFGSGPWRWIGFHRVGDSFAEDLSHNLFLLKKHPIRNAPHMSVYYLQSTQTALSVISSPVMKYRTPMVLVVCTIFCGAVVFLYAMARSDMQRRNRIRKTLRRQNEYMTALHTTSLGLIGRLEFDDLIRDVLYRAGALTDTRNGFLFYHDPSRDVLVLRVGLGVYEKKTGIELKPGEGLAGRIFKTCQPLLIDDYSSWPSRTAHRPL